MIASEYIWIYFPATWIILHIVILYNIKYFKKILWKEFYAKYNKTMCGGDAIVCNFSNEIKKYILKKRREIKIIQKKNEYKNMVWICNQEYRDMNLCICKKKKKLLFNNVCIRFNDLWIKMHLCNHKSLYVFSIRLLNSKFKLLEFICFYLFYNNRRFFLLLDCSRILIVYFFLFTKSVMSLMNFFLMQIYFFSYFFRCNVLFVYLYV